MRYVPRHLPNKLEYKVLSCISVHYQSRMASNGSAITPPDPLTVQAGQYGESELSWYCTWGCCGCWCLGIQDLYAEGGVDGCEQMCTLHAVFVLGVCLRETWTVW